MEVITASYQTQKTARYSTYGKLSKSTKYFWFALHGSKMTCEQMLYKFAAFDPNKHFVLAPEALNRFYADGFGGDVVASWMTKRDRLSEIEDFSNYLSGLYKKYAERLTEDCTKSILAFSQGGTSMYRWLHARNVDADFLFPYSCWIPEDIDLKESKTDLNLLTTKYTYGLDDQFLTPELISKVKTVIKKNKLDLEILPYDGDHRVSKKQLQVLFNEIKKTI